MPVYAKTRFESKIAAKSAAGCFPVLLLFFSPPDRKGLLDFMLESAFAMLLHHAPTQYPARAARQWIPPGIPPEQLASGSRRVSARAARQWIPPRAARQWLANGSRRVSRQSGSPVDPAEYPTTAARQCSSPVDPAKYPARVARQWIPPSIPPEQPAN